MSNTALVVKFQKHGSNVRECHGGRHVSFSELGSNTGDCISLRLVERDDPFAESGVVSTVDSGGILLQK
jgi:hypothetical protein